MDSEEDDQLFTTFTHKEPFLALLTTLLASSDGREDAEEDKLVAQMGAIVGPCISIAHQGEQYLRFVLSMALPLQNGPAALEESRRWFQPKLTSFLLPSP
jgi:hypothetical protein